MRTLTGAALAACLTAVTFGAPVAGASARAASANPVVTIVAPTQAVPAGRLPVTLSLAPADRAGLAALAAKGGTAIETPAQRAAALAAVAPKAATKAAVGKLLTAAGLTVAHDDDAWTVHASGTAAVLQKAFHTALRRSGSRFWPATEPVNPAGVEAVLGLDNREIAHPLDTPLGYQPRDLKAAYAVDRPQSTGFGTTIATVQLSGWDSSSLTHYASEIGVTLAAGQLTQISVDGASTTTPDNGGDVEVALDQETLLGAAPLANQRAYFGPNTGQGLVDIYNKIANDVPTTGIDTASSSWGGCEANSNTAFKNAVRTAIQHLLANGGTFFASSGDSGAYDCSTPTSGNTTLAVDFPASLPETVAVGGTKLLNPTTTPSESAWGDTSRANSATGFAGTGSGGGLSSVYAKPSYQTASGTMRMVPDVSSDADPDTGVDVYVNGSDGQYGGTSLSSPMWAAYTADALSSLGCSTGLGDIHTLLYASRSFTDVTTGNNLRYNATAGYDLATGLGTPIWRSLALELQPTAGCSGGDYFPVTPARLLDTRNGTGAPQAKVGPAGTVSLTVLGVAGVPATGVSAVVLNVTAVNPSAATYLTVFPTGTAQPNASNLNAAAGVTVPNLVTIGVGTGGKVSFFNNAGNVDLLADVQGYYASGTATTLGARYVPLTPSRLLDTRNGTGAVQAPLAEGGTLSFTAVGAGGVAAANVAAVELNLTAVNPSLATYLTAFASGTTQPAVSNLNPAAGQTVPNSAIVPVGSDGKVTVYNNAGSTDLIADVVGYFASAAGTSGSRFVPVSPTRLLDTRFGTGAPQAQVGPGATLPLTVIGAGPVPSRTVSAVALNVTVVNPSAPSYLTVYPSGVAQPNASNLNYIANQTVPNLVTVKAGSDGKINLFNSTGTTDLIADVDGFYYS